MLITFLGLFY